MTHTVKHLAPCWTQNAQQSSRWAEVGSLPHLPRPPKCRGSALQCPRVSALTRRAKQSSPAEDQAMTTSLSPQRKPHQPPAGLVGSLVPPSCCPARIEARKLARGSTTAPADRAGWVLLLASDLQRAVVNRGFIRVRTSFI